MIKAFLFDYGGVITDGGKGPDIPKRLANNLGLRVDEAYSLLSPVWDDFSRGHLTEAQVWQNIEQAYGKPISAIKRDIWNHWDTMQPLPEMVELLRKLKAQGFRVGLVSNVFLMTKQEVEEHGGYDELDFTVMSCDIGACKPEPAIYAEAMKYLPAIDPSEVVFLDDQERCLVPARALGMQTILVENSHQAIADINKLLTA